mmetsp:Transcript_44878/g.80821  ORF Transcript_44878/g.80821 Transcript_44878/m.80821 type:complete len:302 (+) Transcript_44878:341-1246(+)
MAGTCPSASGGHKNPLALAALRMHWSQEVVQNTRRHREAALMNGSMGQSHQATPDREVRHWVVACLADPHNGHSHLVGRGPQPACSMGPQDLVVAHQHLFRLFGRHCLAVVHCYSVVVPHHHHHGCHGSSQAVQKTDHQHQGVRCLVALRQHLLGRLRQHKDHLVHKLQHMGQSQVWVTARSPAAVAALVARLLLAVVPLVRHRSTQVVVVRRNSRQPMDALAEGILGKDSRAEVPPAVHSNQAAADRNSLEAVLRHSKRLVEDSCLEVVHQDQLSASASPLAEGPWPCSSCGSVGQWLCE